MKEKANASKQTTNNLDQVSLTAVKILERSSILANTYSNTKE